MRQAASLIACAAFSAAAAAHATPGAPTVGPAQLRVDQAFIDAAGNLIVRFKLNSVHPMPSDFYWAPHDEANIYELSERVINGTALDYRMRFSAPTASQPDQTGEIHVERGETLTLTHDGATARFTRVHVAGERELEQILASGKVTYSALPDVRQIEYFFKIADSDEYVLVTSPKLNFSYDFDVLIGRPGQLRSVAVLNVDRLRDSATYVNLADGRQIYSPSVDRRAGLPKLKDSLRDPIGTTLIPQEKSLATLAALGVNTEQFRTPELVTPFSGPGRCKAVFEN